MRINKYIALASGVSRRSADSLISQGRVCVNGTPAITGQIVNETTDKIEIDHSLVGLPKSSTTIILNKPVGYVCSREGQGSSTIYELLPTDLHMLKPVGRLDKDSSGLLIMTNDGKLAQTFTHPKYEKSKRYKVKLNKQLTKKAREQLKHGVNLSDGMSHLTLDERSVNFSQAHNTAYIVTMTEGRNRQIRRTFAKLGYNVTQLHRLQIGDYSLNNLQIGKWISVKDASD